MPQLSISHNLQTSGLSPQGHSVPTRTGTQPAIPAQQRATGGSGPPLERTLWSAWEEDGVACVPVGDCAVPKEGGEAVEQERGSLNPDAWLLNTVGGPCF